MDPLRALSNSVLPSHSNSPPYTVATPSTVMGVCHLEGHEHHIVQDDRMCIVLCNCQNHPQNHSRPNSQTTGPYSIASTSSATNLPSSLPLEALDGTRVTDEELLFFTNLPSPSPALKQPLHQVRDPPPSMDQVQHRNIRALNVFSPIPMSGDAAINHSDDQPNQTVHGSNTLPEGSALLAVHLHSRNTADTVIPTVLLRSESSSSISPPPAINSSVETRCMGNGDGVGLTMMPHIIEQGSLGFDIDVPVCLASCTDLGLLHLDTGQPDASDETDTSVPTAERHHPRATVSRPPDASLPPLPSQSTTAENTHGVLAQHLSQRVSGLSSDDNTAVTISNTTGPG
ncbi:hypothetical protein HK102_008748, partial [Quaeritorhiza haematococci]